MKKWSLKYTTEGYVIINKGGTNLNYEPLDGIQILEEDGYAFLDLNGNGRIDSFEDWRLGKQECFHQLCLNLI